MKFDGYITQIILAVFLAFAGWLGFQIKALYNKYVTTEVKRSIVRTTVRYVEQVYKDIHGADKLKEAMKKASALLAEYGIEISDHELVSLIEAAVNEFNNAFNKKIEQISE